MTAQPTKLHTVTIIRDVAAELAESHKEIERLRALVLDFEHRTDIYQRVEVGAKFVDEAAGRLRRVLADKRAFSDFNALLQETDLVLRKLDSGRALLRGVSVEEARKQEWKDGGSADASDPHEHDPRYCDACKGDLCELCTEPYHPHVPCRPRSNVLGERKESRALHNADDAQDEPAAGDVVVVAMSRDAIDAALAQDTNARQIDRFGGYTCPSCGPFCHCGAR